MKKLVYSILFISTITNAQIEKEVGSFNKVTSFDQINVTLIKSNENKVIITGNGEENVEVINKKGELKIRMPLTKLLSGSTISATVYYKYIDAVEANEGSKITSEDVFNATAFDLIAKEGSKINIQLDVSRLSLRVANGSTVSIEGNVENQEVIINSGGIYNAKNLISKQTIITTNAGGSSEIFASKFVDAKVRAGGIIFIYGKPKQINQKVIAGGTIKEVK